MIIDYLHIFIDKPTFYGDIKKEIELHNLKFAVSISHDGEYAIAFVSSL